MEDLTDDTNLTDDTSIRKTNYEYYLKYRSEICFTFVLAIIAWLIKFVLLTPEMIATSPNQLISLLVKNIFPILAFICSIIIITFDILILRNPLRLETEDTLPGLEFRKRLIIASLVLTFARSLLCLYIVSCIIIYAVSLL